MWEFIVNEAEDADMVSDESENEKFRACVRYFLFFHQMIAL